MTRRTKIAWSLGIFVALIIAARVAAPYLVLRYVNRTLDGLDGYGGHVDDVDLALWRGAYCIEGVRIVKTGGRVPVPLFSSPRIDLQVQWRALFDGAVVAQIELFRPKINIVAPPDEGDQSKGQTEVAGNWQTQVKKLVPLDINRFEIHDGEIHYRDFHAKPRVDVYVQDIEGRMDNLTNSRKLSKSLVARADFRGLAMHSGRFFLKASVDPFAKLPTFSMAAGIEELDVKQLNDFLRAYAGLDAEAGKFSMYTQLESKQGRFNGYVKPFLEHLQVFDLHQKNEGALRKAWEAVAQGVTNVFESDKPEQVATKIPLSGRIDKPRPDIWTSIVYVLRNAFVQALQHGLEGSFGKLGPTSQRGDED